MKVMASRGHRSLVETGKLAPGFRLAGLDGSETALGELISPGAVLLVFFKITCPVCQLSMPYLERLHAAGMRVYGISQNGAEETAEFAAYFGASFPMLLDPEDEDFPASNAYGIATVPTMFVVETDGVVSRAIEGWNRKDMEGLGALAGMALFRAEDNVPAWKAG